MAEIKQIDVGGVLYDIVASDINPTNATQTLNNIGAAPSGYGLGENGPNTSNINNNIKNGYFRATSQTENTPFTHLAAHVMSYSSSEVIQHVVRTTDGCMMIRRTTDGGATWIEEWINPPMDVGVEYRTIERYGGKPIYTKAIDVGALPNASYGALSFTLSSRETLIACSGVAASPSGLTRPFPCESTSDVLGSIGLVLRCTGTATISGGITTTTDLSNHTGVIIVKYTKSTD